MSTSVETLVTLGVATSPGCTLVHAKGIQRGDQRSCTTAAPRRRLEVFTVAWNSLEGLVSVGLGVLAGSIALVGFGVDSFIETSSGLILLWRLQTHRDEADAERAEVRALKLVGLSLLLLAAYILYVAEKDFPIDQRRLLAVLRGCRARAQHERRSQQAQAGRLHGMLRGWCFGDGFST